MRKQSGLFPKGNHGPFALQLGAGMVPGVEPVYKFGRDPAVSDTEKLVAALPGAYPGFLTAAAAVRVKAGGDAADDAAGLGAQSVVVVGLDENWERAEETLVTAGASASSPTTTTFIRVFRAYVLDVGTYGAANTGNIELETTGADSVALIAAGLGQTQLAFYSVPANCKAYIAEWRALTEGTKAVTFTMYQRQGADVVADPFRSPRIVHTFPLAANQSFRAWPAGFKEFPAMTDIYVTAYVATGNSAAVTSFDLLVVDD